MAASQRQRSIPDDIVLAILPRLPVKTLLRFKCVSKQWHSIISGPNFKLVAQDQRLAIVVSHSESELPNPTIEYHSITDGFCVEKLYADPTTSCYHAIDKHDCPTFTNNFDHKMRLLGSGNGLVLFGLDEHIFLWNPWTRCCRKVLELKALANSLKDVDASGLCYDSYTDDYKALVIINNKFIGFASLKTKEWRDVETPNNYYAVGGGLVVNERLHWLCGKPIPFGVGAERIACFDSSSNKLEMLPAWPAMGSKDFACALGVVYECLCIIRPWGWSHEVWVMKEYGVAESWTFMFFLDNIEFSFMGPAVFTRGDEALIFPTFGRIVAYDVKKRSCTDLSVGDYRSDILFARSRVESLVSPIEFQWNDN